MEFNRDRINILAVIHSLNDKLNRDSISSVAHTVEWFKNEDIVREVNGKMEIGVAYTVELLVDVNYDRSLQKVTATYELLNNSAVHNNITVLNSHIVLNLALTAYGEIYVLKLKNMIRSGDSEGVLGYMQRGYPLDKLQELIDQVEAEKKAADKAELAKKVQVSFVTDLVTSAKV